MMKRCQVELRNEDRAPVFYGVEITMGDHWLVIEHLDETETQREKTCFPASAVRCVREWEEEA